MFMIKYNKKHIWISGLVGILISSIFYVFISNYIKHMALELTTSLIRSEMSSIQQGNLLSSVTKFQRTIEQSEFIKGIKLITIRNDKVDELISIGAPFSIIRDDLYSNQFNVKVSGVFQYRVSYQVPNQVNTFILFHISPNHSWKYLLSFLLLISILYFLATYLYIKSKNKEHLQNEKTILSAINEISNNNHLPIRIKKEFPSIEKHWIDLQYYMKKKNKENIELDILKKTNQISRQISHDIRSPLAVLKMILKNISPLIDEENRAIVKSQVQRINDIINNLVSENRVSLSNRSLKKKVFLYSCIDEIITEKRLEYRKYIHINIDSDIDNCYGVFANIREADLKRVLSNIINNSVDALKSYSGNIDVYLKEDTVNSKIVIEDNGRGIPKDKIPHIFELGFSYGKNEKKDSGNGLGLHHAHKWAESVNGSIEIESKLNIGTKTTITLPKINRPNWFSPVLTLNKKNVIILDDDVGIHNTWKKRINDLSKNIKIYHFSTVLELTNYLNKNKQNAHYLFDYEIINEKKTGLDIIDEFSLEDAILITSHFDEIDIQERCEQLSVKMIPKMLAGSVPITWYDQFYDAVYIEDNELLRTLWVSSAKKNGINLLALPSFKEFYKHKKNISKKNTHIYIDREIEGETLKGEIFAATLHKLGHQKLTMSTGYDPEFFKDYPWLEVRNKFCPWS